MRPTWQLDRCGLCLTPQSAAQQSPHSFSADPSNKQSSTHQALGRAHLWCGTPRAGGWTRPCSSQVAVPTHTAARQPTRLSHKAQRREVAPPGAAQLVLGKCAAMSVAGGSLGKQQYSTLAWRLGLRPRNPGTQIHHCLMRRFSSALVAGGGLHTASHSSQGAGGSKPAGRPELVALQFATAAPEGLQIAPPDAAQLVLGDGPPALVTGGRLHTLARAPGSGLHPSQQALHGRAKLHVACSARAQCVGIQAVLSLGQAGREGERERQGRTQPRGASAAVHHRGSARGAPASGWELTCSEEARRRERVARGEVGPPERPLRVVPQLSSSSDSELGLCCVQEQGSRSAINNKAAC